MGDSGIYKIPEADLMLMTFDDMICYIPILRLLEKKDIDIPIATYMWFFGRFITHCFYNNDLDTVYFLIGCQTEILSVKDPSKQGYQTMQFPHLKSTKKMLKLVNAAQGDLATYQAYLETINVKYPQGYNKLLWERVEVDETSLGAVRSGINSYKLLEEFKANGLPIVGPFVEKVVKKPEIAPDDPPKTSEELKLEKLNEEIKKAEEKLKSLSLTINASRGDSQVPGLNPSNEELIVKLQEKSEDLNRKLGAAVAQEDLLTKMLQERDRELMSLRKRVSSYVNCTLANSTFFQEYLDKLNNAVPYFPEYMQSLPQWYLSTKLYELGGSFGPLTAMESLDHKEVAYNLTSMWNTYLIREIVKTGNYDSNAKIFKDVKDHSEIVKEAVSNIITELGLVKGMNEKMAAVIDYINKEKIQKASSSTKETTLSDVSKPEASARVAQILETTKGQGVSTPVASASGLSKYSKYVRPDGTYAFK